MKLKNVLLLLESDWWEKLSPEEQEDYIQKHPKSKKAIQAKKNKKSTSDQKLTDPNTNNSVVEKMSYKLDTNEIKAVDDYYKWYDDFVENGELVSDLKKYVEETGQQYSNFKSKLSKKEQNQLETDIDEWKKIGGYSAYNYADTEEQKRQAFERSQRLSNLAHNSVVKVKQPIERGIDVPPSVADKFIEKYKIGSLVEIPSKDGHGCSGFSLSSKVARRFSNPYNLKPLDPDDELNPDYVFDKSILFRIIPNTKGEVRGLFIDGDSSLGEDDFTEEMEILRSPQSKLKVVSIQRKPSSNGSEMIIIELQELEDLNENKMDKKQKELDFDKISLKYLSGPVNRKRFNKKNDKKIKLSKLIKK